MIKRIGLALACLCLAASPAAAVNVSIEASNLGSPVATGSFSYADGKTGVLGYGELTSFTLTIGPDTYTLGEVLALTDYVQFAYDTSANILLEDPNSCGFGGCGFDSILSAVSADGTSGFFFSPPSGGGFLDYANYDPDVDPRPYDTLKLTVRGQPQAVPEPAAWLTMIVGFGLVGGDLRRARSVAARSAALAEQRPA